MLGEALLRHPALRAFWAATVVVLVMLLRGATDAAGMPEDGDWLRAAPFLLAFAAGAAVYGHGARYLRRAMLLSVLGLLGAAFDSVVLRRAGLPGLAAWAWMAPACLVGGFCLAVWRPGSAFRGIWNM